MVSMWHKGSGDNKICFCLNIITSTVCSLFVSSEKPNCKTCRVIYVKNDLTYIKRIAALSEVCVFLSLFARKVSKRHFRAALQDMTNVLYSTKAKLHGKLGVIFTKGFINISTKSYTLDSKAEINNNLGGYVLNAECQDN